MFLIIFVWYITRLYFLKSVGVNRSAKTQGKVEQTDPLRLITDKQ